MGAVMETKSRVPVNEIGAPENTPVFYANFPVASIWVIFVKY